jgi:fatty acid-binding protein DegV
MIKILCDSITDLPIEIIEKHNVDIVPLTVIFNEKEYLDRVDITNKEFFKAKRKVENGKQPNNIKVLSIQIC